ncbi:MAG TPA: DnaD domain protein [Leptolinea sp.]
MKSFQGFPSGKTRLIPIPADFFTEVLPDVDDLNLLKVMLHIFRALDFQDGPVRFLRMKDLMQDEILISSLISSQADKKPALTAAIDRAVAARFILKSELNADLDSQIFFLNSARGREALAALQSGKWKPEDQGSGPNHLPPSQPGIFQLYEENIGPLTPILADILQEVEKNYPQAVIQYAFEEAVKQNARSWKYIEAILRNWQEKGSNGQSSRDPEKDRRKYIEGDYAEFINHE